MSGGTRSYEMSRRLASWGHEVHVVTSWRGQRQTTGRWFQEIIGGVHVHWLPVPYSNRMSYSERFRAFFHFALAAGPKASRIGGDLVFATSTPLTIAVSGAYSSKRLRIPMVFEVRDLWPEVPMAVGAIRNPILISAAKWLERFAYRNSAHVVALSPGMARGILKSGCSAKRISVVPNGSDIDLFRVPPTVGKSFLESHQQFAKGPLVVYAGTLGLINGVSYFVELAYQMKALDPTVVFLIVGEGREEEVVRQKATKLGVLNHNLWMMPSLAKEAMPAILSAATVTCSLVIDLPATWDNSANKVFDGFAAGRPVMINHGGWLAELLKETGAGIVVAPSDPRGAAEVLWRFIGDEVRLEKARKAAAHLADTRFNRDRLAGMLLKVLEEAVREAKEERGFRSAKQPSPAL
jgi:glycosyltransferase involved in cell wall biosynthesis